MGANGEYDVEEGMNIIPSMHSRYRHILYLSTVSLSFEQLEVPSHRHCHGYGEVCLGECLKK